MADEPLLILRYVPNEKYLELIIHENNEPTKTYNVPIERLIIWNDIIHNHFAKLLSKLFKKQ